MTSLLRSHRSQTPDFQAALDARRKQIIQAGDSPRSSVRERLEILHQLSTFELGRFLIVQQGMNGFWTDYVCRFPLSQRDPRTLAPLERFLLCERPVGLATQERFQTFLRIGQKYVRDGARLGSVPSGVMADLLLLDYSDVKTIELVAMDLDPETLQHAISLAQEKRLSHFMKAREVNAWSLGEVESFDLLCSSGLNIYVESDQEVTALYQQLLNALKPGGTLLTSYLSSPPWKSEAIDPEALRKQHVIYGDVLQFTGSHLRSADQTRDQLLQAGFVNVQFYPDRAGLFPTVTAHRPIRT